MFNSIVIRLEIINHGGEFCVEHKERKVYLISTFDIKRI